MSCNLIGDINRTTDPVFAVDTILKLHVKGILGHLQRGQGIICLKLEPTISRLREYTGFYAEIRWFQTMTFIVGMLT